MVDFAPGSLLNFDTGISRVVWDMPAHTSGALPDRRQLPPSELAATLQLDRLLLSDNIETSLTRSLRPSVGSPDILQPDRFSDALGRAGRALERPMPDVSGEDKAALDGLSQVLKERTELQEAFHFYRDMLIAG